MRHRIKRLLPWFFLAHLGLFMLYAYAATSITTRAGKGSPLTWSELDANFTNLRATADNADGVAAAANITAEWAEDIVANRLFHDDFTPGVNADTHTYARTTPGAMGADDAIAQLHAYKYPGSVVGAQATFSNLSSSGGVTVEKGANALRFHVTRNSPTVTKYAYLYTTGIFQAEAFEGDGSALTGLKQRPLFASYSSHQGRPSEYTTAYTATIPANALAANGDIITVTLGSRKTATDGGVSTTLRLTLGGVNADVITTGTDAAAIVTTWHIVRTGTTTARIVPGSTTGTASSDVDVGGLDFSGSIGLTTYVRSTQNAVGAVTARFLAGELKRL